MIFGKRAAMKQQNPFSYTFGVKPVEYIPNEQEDIILDNFMYENPTERAYMITGVRGSGKTVMLSDISESLERAGSWIICDLNPAIDLRKDLAARLYEQPFMKAHFLSARIDLSLFGFGAEISDGEKIVEIESLIERMLDVVQKQKKKVMVTIDEAASGKEMQVFCLAFQKFIRKKLPIYIIMTGLYNKIHNIKNMKDCTFLQRAPYITLEPLDLSAIALRYQKVFYISREASVELAKLTKGYAFAFQVLGKLYYDKKDGSSLEDIIPIYESELIRYSYRKIWSELSRKDKDIVIAMVEINDGNNIYRQQLMEKTGLNSAMINRYQGRLREQGVLASPEKGTYSLALPLFQNFVREYYIG